MIWYGLPAWTLGNSEPMWILWTITGRSTRVAGIGIGCLRCVAQDAHLDAAPRAAVRGELVMTSIAALGSNHVMRHRDRASRWARS